MRPRFGLLLLLGLFVGFPGSPCQAENVPIRFENKKRLENKTKKTTANRDRYLLRKEKLTDDVKSQLRLAKWCERRDLKKESRTHYDRVLELDPDNQTARGALRHKLVKGKWRLPPSERARRRKKAETRELAEKNAPRPRSRMRLQCEVPEEQEAEYLKGTLRQFCQKLPVSVYLLTGKRSHSSDEYVCHITLKIEKGETSKFYGKDLSNNFTGVARVEIRRVGEKHPVLGQDVTHRFTATLELPEPEARAYAYRETVDAVITKLRRHRFFKARGAMPARAPEA